ncbi:unnamed protein product [Caenorhabditis brenneri]
MFCFPTGDFLVHIIGEMSSTHGYFRNLNESHWKMISLLFDKLANKIEVESEGCKFIETKSAFKIQEWMFNEMEKIFVRHPKNTKDISRSMRDDCFKTRDLLWELKELGIAESFPTVLNFVNTEFSNPHKLEKFNRLTEGDVKCAAESIAGNCVLRKYKKIMKIIHQGGYCDEVIMLNCDFCKGYTLQEEDEFSNRTKTKTGKKKEKKRQTEKKNIAKEKRTDVEEAAHNLQAAQLALEDLTQIAAQILEAPHVSNAPEVNVGEEQINQNPVEQQVVEGPPALDVPQANNAPGVAQPTVPKPEPGSCMKCFRTSQFCEDAKTKLREEQIKNKALRKQVRQGAEREAEKDEEIRELKEKLAALEASIQANAVENSQQPASDSEENHNDENDPPLRYLAPTNKNSQFSEEVRNKFNELLNLKDTQYTVEREAIRRANEVVKEANDNGNKQMARLELRCIQQKYTEYIKVVDYNLSLIREHKSVENLKPLPEIPRFSENFEEIYQVVVMKELKDKTCLFCCMEMEDLRESIKCGCSRRYHRHCAWDVDAKGFKCLCTRKLPLD